MTLRIIEGFDLFTASALGRADIARRWSGANTSLDASGPQTETGHHHGLAWEAIATAETLHTRTLTEDTEWTLGFDVSLKNSPVTTGLRVRFYLSGVLQLEFKPKSTAAGSTTFGFYRGATQVGSDLVLTAAASKTSWQYVEIRVKFSATAGEVEAYVDGVQSFAATALNTVDTGAGGADSFDVTIQDDGGTGWTLLDHLYAMDASGGSFLGVQVVEERVATADGTTSGWTPSTGTDHYAMVDEAAADDAATYLESDADDELDLMDYENLASIAGAIEGVEVETQAAVSSWGTRKMKPMVRTNSTNVEGDEETVNSATFAAFRQMWEDNPEAGGAWTPAAVNAAEFGVKRSG